MHLEGNSLSYSHSIGLPRHSPPHRPTVPAALPPIGTFVPRAHPPHASPTVRCSIRFSLADLLSTAAATPYPLPLSFEPLSGGALTLRARTSKLLRVAQEKTAACSSLLVPSRSRPSPLLAKEHFTCGLLPAPHSPPQASLPRTPRALPPQRPTHPDVGERDSRTRIGAQHAATRWTTRSGCSVRAFSGAAASAPALDLSSKCCVRRPHWMVSSHRPIRTGSSSRFSVTCRRREPSVACTLGT